MRPSRAWGDPEGSAVVTLVAERARRGWREALTVHIEGHTAFLRRLSDRALETGHRLPVRDRPRRAPDIGCGFGSLTLGQCPPSDPGTAGVQW
jgi:hypothetical protein